MAIMPGRTRDALLDSAGTLLDGGGPDAVTLREVGRLAGVSHNAPYRHFPSKEALLAAFAARELDGFTRATSAAALRDVLRTYLAWAERHPARFRLVFGAWTVDSPELAVAAHAAQAQLVAQVGAAQAAGELPAADPERLAALVRSAAHGAAELAASGHLSPGGKGHADPAGLVEDLLGYLRAAATSASS